MRKTLETINRFADGSVIARREYRAGGVLKVYTWTKDTSGNVMLDAGEPEPVAVAAIFDGDTDHTATPSTLSKVAFMDMAYPLLGEGMAGVQRYGEVLTEAKASTSPLVVAAMERYTHANDFERDDVATFLDILVSDPGIGLSAMERDAVIGGWPDETPA
ncbi:hypothetical protein [Kordiimonas sp.]|uniref:hypothetical protein n=1 Tax=Kordiimonas sp. TaxID=1970157 RepID=UPI003A91249B